MKRCSSRGLIALVAALALLAFYGAALADPVSETPMYVENEWDFVDGSMNVSAGIPEDAEGVLANIRDAGVLRVATEPYYPPQEFIDPDLSGQDRYVGPDMEMARLIAERMGVELVIVPMDFTDVLPAVSEGKCDLAISALAYTPARASAVEFSKGYFFTESAANCGIIIRTADAESIAGIDDLAGRNIAAQSGSLQETLMAGHVTNYREFRRMPSVQAVYDAVENGTVDAATVDVESAQNYIEHNPECGLMLLPDVGFELGEQYEGDRVAGRKGELQLMYFVNGVIDELLESGQYRLWYEQSEARAAELGM